MKLRRIDLAVSIIAAIALWFYVVNILNPPITVQFRDVPITITGEADLENSGLALREGTELKTTVSVKGPRNVVNGVRTEDIILTVDVSALEKGQATAPVHAQLPSGVSLGELQSPNVELTVEELVSVSKPVTVVLTGSSEGREATLLPGTLTQMVVTGASSQVALVDSVLVSGDLTGSELDVAKEMLLAGVPVDESGRKVTGVRLANDAISVNAVLYQTKSVPLSVPVEGSVWEGASLTSSNISPTIIIKGPASLLSQISGIEAEPVDIDGMYESSVLDVVPKIPGGVFVADSSPKASAEFVISDTGSLTFDFNTGDIVLKDLAEGLDASIILPEGYKNVVAVVTGKVSTLRTLAAGEIAPVVSAAGLAAGEHLESILPRQNISGLTVVYSPDRVTVRVK